MLETLINDENNLGLAYTAAITLACLILPWILLKVACRQKECGNRRLWIRELLPPAISLSLLSVSYLAVQKYWPQSDTIVIGVNIAVLWLLVSAVRLFTENRSVLWLLFLLFVPVFVLDYLDLLGPSLKVLGTFSLSFGDSEISLLDVLKSVIAIAFLLWASKFIVRMVANYLRSLRGLHASSRDLAIKIATVVIYSLAVIAGLDLLGIDFTALTVFGGALGIGIGFGLQKITSNFISGLILLFEKSVEQDDLVELPDGTTGFVRKNGMRYTLIETFDNREVLVPNEDFITGRVTNWTFSNSKGRIEIPVGVSYKSDIKKARDLILEAAAEDPSCSKSQPPACYLQSFGDSSVNFTLWFWVDDVITGRWKPRSDVLFAIWDKFAANGIEIPFPQRDIHIRSNGAIKDICES